MRKPLSLAARLGAIGSALLLMALASIGLTLWVTWQLEGGAAAVNEAGRMRMQTWRMAQTLSSADPSRLPPQLAQFEQTLALLRQGDVARPLFVPQDARSSAAFDEVRRGWGALRSAWTASPRPGADAAAAQAEAFVARIDDFVTAIETQLARWTALLNAFQFVMMALALGSAVALLYSAYLFVFNPLVRLQTGLARVGEGDLTARVAVDRDDEFGALSAGFNRMAQTLQGLYQSLESRVQEKTLGLEAERARLAALYEATAFVATATSLDVLAKGFAQQVRRVARADASAVRWSDESNQRYLLLASDCLPAHVVEAEHCVPTGGCFCGQPQGEAHTRVIPIRPTKGDAMPGQCERAGFDTVVSVPVRLHERMVGELNLFYRSAAALGDEDRALLETLASHLAGAIEGLRAGALEREAAVAEERSLLARELHDSIAQSLSFLKIQAALLREALKRQDAARIARTLDELDEGIRESLADVRELLLHFRTRTNREDIAPALRTTLRKFEHQTGLATHLAIEGEGMPLDPDVQVQVLHVVQEALSNVRKHAQAHEVWIEVQQSPPQWRVEVRDDGRGFEDLPAAADETHVGLRIMRERAQRIGATVEVASVPGSGTCVVLTLPQRLAVAA
ncbi:MAG: type IV pili methyl-accepting chemotaxis transducer N-terminal domain-containing protein [Burkholderiaceae bacterium]|nr:type IV pili methyl-accepting chemotaxis transducer N-terminal domain-containing protein [Burkholderiaceae bacterium]